MAQTKEGATKVLAKRTGLSVDEYRARRAAGEKWCWKCTVWSPVSMFCSDSSRSDGLSAVCGICRRVKVRVSTKGRVSTFKGREHTAEARLRISLAKKGRPNLHRLGKRHSLEARAKISAATRAAAVRGPACHSYKDGKTAERRGERHSAMYKQWRYSVFLRDGFACCHCSDDRGGNLHAHHIRPFAEYPALRFEPANGVTLCQICHRFVHEYGLQLWAPCQ